MAALKSAGIPYEVVPGITAGIAAPAYFGIPVTHRGMSRAVSFITASTKDDGLPDLDWEALVRMEGTLVFYMGMRAVPEICRQLMAHGMNGSQKAAIVSRGTTPNEQLLSGELAQFTSDYTDYMALSPGLFVVGDVVSFADDYAWRPTLPLREQKIIVTRSLAQASKLSSRLEALGAEVVLLPTIEIAPIADLSALSEQIRQIGRYSWILFTSINAVEVFFVQLQKDDLDIRALSGCKIGAVGTATKHRLHDFGVRADFVPHIHTGKDFAEELLEQYPDIRGTEVLIPASAIAHTEICQVLEAGGVQCLQLPVYENHAIKYDSSYLEELLSDGCGWLTFCSSSAVDNFMHLIQEHRLEHLIQDIKMAVIGHFTARTLSKYDLKYSAMPESPSLEALVDEIISQSHKTNISCTH